MKAYIFLFLTATLFWANISVAQDAILKDSTVIMAAGLQYKASGWKKLWWGKHYRNEWMAPVKFPVIDLDATAGGLTAIKMGGGHETQSLRMIGANGREYVLRSIDKSLNELVPEDFRGSFINDLVNDQISTAHPFGYGVIAKLSEAANIYHTNPLVVFVPANNRLNEFENNFANKLYLFEERPSGQGWGHLILTGDADAIINTEKLIQKLKEDNDNTVDQSAFLKVRLFDMWINDWDRHEDQWVWLANKQGNKTLYTAFARDRDQSFSKTDGINLYFLSRPWTLQSLQNLDSKVKNVIGTALAARFMDKQFLTELNKDDWKKIILELQSSLTDDVIKNAVNSLPDTIVKLSGKWLIDKLISRRNDMMRYGMKYYTILNKQVDIVGSDKSEYFSINNKSADEIEITIQKLNKEQIKEDTIFHKIFKKSETNKLYLYGLAEDDVFYTTGTPKSKIKLVIVAGKGNDQFTVDSAAVTGKKILVYDEAKNKVEVAPIYKTYFTNDTLFNNYNRRHFQYNWYSPLIIPSYNPDDGFSMGAGFIYKKQSWAKVPFEWQQSFGASLSFGTGATGFFYSGKFQQVFGKWNLELPLTYKGPQYVFNFYGYGNDTKLLTDDRAYNRVRIEQFIVNPKIARTFGLQEFKVGPILETIKAQKKEGKYVSENNEELNEIVFKNNTFMGGNLQYSIGKKDNIKFPTKGYSFQTDFTYKKNTTKGSKDFVNTSVSFHFYLPLGKIILAHRTGFATNMGDYEFYHANTLGGISNLRGYYRTRFTGQTAFYQNTELRWAFANLKGYVLRGKLGVYGFFDDGRVWTKNDKSSELHKGYGGGIFFIPYSAATINIDYGISGEANIIKLGLDFFF